MTITDTLVLILSIFFLVRGASRGFMRTLAGPFSIIAATAVSIIYYQATKNVTVSLIIGLLGPFLLTMLLKFLLKAWANATNNNIKPGFLSRLSGAVLNLVWGWVFIILTLIFLALMPPWGETLKAVHKDVLSSSSYLLVKPMVGYSLSAAKQNVPSVSNNDQPAGAVEPVDAKSLAQDPRFQKILQDPEIQKEINAHDMVDLMKNPKMLNLVQQVMNDPATMNKVLSVYKSQAQPAGN